MSPMRIQGLLFCGLALLGGAGGALGLLPTGPSVVAPACAAIAILGVPHGALDGMFALRRAGADAWGLARFAVSYAALAALLFALWPKAPLLCFWGFIAVSGWHFSGDLEGDVSAPSRILYGGAAIVLPALLHLSHVEAFLTLWIGPEGTSQVLPVLHGLAPYWLVLLLLTAVDELTRRSGAALELLAVAALGTLAPAVIGFAIFFCAMHSARHVLRGVGLVGRMAPRAWLLGLGLPLVGTIALGALAWPRVGDASLDARLVRLLFTGLAALTVPHLAVVEPIRFAGWLLVPRRTLFPIGGATQGPGPHA